MGSLKKKYGLSLFSSDSERVSLYYIRACETIWHLMWTEWQNVDNLARKMDILAGILGLAHNLPLLG